MTSTERVRLWRLNHPERRKEHDKKYREGHRAQARAASDKWKEDHHEQCLSRRRERRKERAEYYREIERARHWRNREHLTFRARQWKKENPDKVKANNHNRRALRKNAIGKINAVVIMAVKIRDGFRCLACGATEKLTIDHIIPLKMGGTNEMSNLQTLCYSCNSGKRLQTIDYRN